MGSHLTHLKLLGGGRMSEDRGAISLWETARHKIVEDDQSSVEKIAKITIFSPKRFFPKKLTDFLEKIAKNSRVDGKKLAM
jgi:hypothetical protein